jgi:catechol-2,3-dioxygenase
VVAKLVCALGEISIRVLDMDRMVSFYCNVLGFELRRRFKDDVAAIKIANGLEGQVQTLTLFASHLPGNIKSRQWSKLDNDSTTLHHFALTIPNTCYEELKLILSHKNIYFEIANHRWTGWKGIYIEDPEQNIIEFVCYDENYDDGKNNSYDFDKLHGAQNGQAFL